MRNSVFLPVLLIFLVGLSIVGPAQAKKHSMDKLLQIQNATLQQLTQLNAQENLNSKILLNIMTYTHILELAQTKNTTVLPIK